MMKAGIDATGRLTIKAETDLEHYALSKWWDDWQEHKVCLMVEIAKEGNPDCVTIKQVRNDPLA